MYKIIAILACLAAIAAALPYKPAPAPYYEESKEDHHHPAQYKFEYGVKDDHTGDHKTHWEQRDGEHVKGQYTVEEADGGHRLVEYESDAHGGINVRVAKVGGSGPAPKAKYFEPELPSVNPIKKPAGIKKPRY